MIAISMALQMTYALTFIFHKLLIKRGIEKNSTKVVASAANPKDLTLLTFLLLQIEYTPIKSNMGNRIIKLTR